LDGSYDQTIRAGNTNPETIRVAVGSLKTADNAKITEFAVERAVTQSGKTIGNVDDGSTGADTYNANNSPYTYSYDGDLTASEPGGTTSPDIDRPAYQTTDGSIATDPGAFNLALDDGYFNLSDDGADGVDADGTDTDLTVRDGVNFKIDTSVFSSAFKEKFKTDSLGTFSLGVVAAGKHTVAGQLEAAAFANYDNLANDVEAQFQIDGKTGEITLKAGAAWNYLKLDKDTNDAGADGAADASIASADYEAAAAANFRSFNVIYTARDGTTHTETLNIALSAAAETQLDDIKVESQAEATRAVETLDKALEQVSSAQAKLGAIQNRLQHNIDNLSKGAMLTEQAVGRVVDADFASETSSLSKHQLLNQAATAMLAQANQSKQSVLSLLQ